VCHAILKDVNFFRLLLKIDTELAYETQSKLCPCGGKLHCANYPRKPRGCPEEILNEYSSRFSFCCHLCRQRTTSPSVRFLGRRVYVGLAMILLSEKSNDHTTTLTHLSQTMKISVLTLKRWQSWWIDRFPLTSLWQATCARFIPPVEQAKLPNSLLEQFTQALPDLAEYFTRILHYLSPLS
jgi:hypothetical protein